jgi:arsenite methyltransferase
MQTAEAIKANVREQYGKIAAQPKETNEASCCGVGAPGCSTIMADSYAHLPGYNPEADLGLGCGLPTEFARIQEGDTVLDLGSGAGNDAFVARAETGVTGKVIGVDFTPAMIDRARRNAEKLGYNNVEFRFGDIETLPVNDNSVDVIVSNCVLNLVPNKRQVFAEILRTLRPGGHFSISDVVLVGELPDKVVESAELHAGCVAGAVQLDEYLAIIRETGFENVTIQKQKPILLPDELLLQYLSEEEIRSFVAAGTGIFSVTVYAEKPGGDPVARASVRATAKRTVLASACGCDPASGCC